MAVTDLLTLAEARDALRIPDNDSSRDATLQSTYIPALTAVVEDVTGPVVRRSFTRTFDGGAGAILLPMSASSITSVTESGTLLGAGTDYVSDLSAGVLYRGNSTSRTCFAAGVGTVVLVYVAGICDDTASVPVNIKLAARMILVDSFDTDQQGEHPAFGDTGEGDTTTTPSGYSILSEAYAYLQPNADNLPSFS